MSTTITTTAPKAHRPLRELREWLASGLARCRAQRWFGATLYIDVAGDIAGEVAATQEAAHDAAYSAEQHDLEAENELEAARADLEAALAGGLDNSDLPAVRRALKRLVLARACVNRSAEKDRIASDLLATA